MAGGWGRRKGIRQESAEVEAAVPYAYISLRPFLIGDYMKWSVILFCTIATAVLSAAALGESYPLTVEGIGTVTVPADIVSISISVASSNENLSQAQSELEEEMNSVIIALKKAGVKDEEILPGQGSGISSFQSSSNVCRMVNNTTVCENTTESSLSLQRSAMVRLRSADEPRINRALDAARSAGANAYVVGYGLKDASGALAEARKEALADARRNAAALAEDAGGRLGKAMDIFTYPSLGIDYSYGSGSTRSGMVDVSARVMVTYEFIL